MAETLSKYRNRFKDKCRDIFCNKSSLFYFVLILIGIGIGFYAYSLFTQFWTVPIGGDYTQEQVQFYYNGYDDWWAFFKTGQFRFWDENTFLGADNIGSNSFYYLFDPFFLPILIFPRAAIPQVMACLMIAKMVVAACVFRLYLKYIGVKESTARIFAIAYGFVGWTSFYLWFNHFMEIAVFLPWVLLGIEKLLKTRKPWCLVFALTLTGMTNFFYFVAFCFFGVLYGGFRYFQTIKTRSKKENWLALGIGVGAFAFGIMMCSFVLLPGILTSLTSSRVSSTTYLTSIKEAFACGDIGKVFSILFTDWQNVSSYGHDNYVAYYPIASFFFPTTSNRYVTVLPAGYDLLSSSLYIYTAPMIFVFFGFYFSIKDKKFSHLIAVAAVLLFLFTPFAYQAFFGFTDGYGRWEIFAVILMLTYSALAFDRRKEVSFKWVIILCSICIACMIGAYVYARYLCGVYSLTTMDIDGDILYVVIWEFIDVAAIATLTCALYKHSIYKKIIAFSVAAEAIAMGNVVQCFQGTINYENIGGGLNTWVEVERQAYNKILETDDTYFRVQSRLDYQGNDNAQYLVGYNSTGTFHSIYNYNVIDFVRMSSIFQSDTTWIGNYQEKRFNFDTFVGTKYYFTRDQDTWCNIYDKNTGNYLKTITVEPNVPFNTTRIDDPNVDDGIRVYQNNDWISLGFTFDTLYYKGNKEDSIYNDFHTSDWSDSTKGKNVIRNEECYLNGAILNDEDVEEILNDNPEFTAKHAPTTLNAQEVNITKRTYVANNSSFHFDPENPLEYTNPNICTLKNITAGSMVSGPYVLEITSRTSTYLSDDETGAYLMLNYQMLNKYDAKIYLLDENNKVISCDNHTNPNVYDKLIRGFYAKGKVKRILAVPSKDYYSENYNAYPYTVELFTESRTSINEKLNAIKEEGLLNTKNGTNWYSFDTNNDSKRFVTLQIPYDKGWTVTATDENGNVTHPKAYNTQGGFIGFVAPAGKMHYQIDFLTYGFKTGMIIAGSAFGVLAAGTTGHIIMMHMKKKAHREDEHNDTQATN